MKFEDVPGPSAAGLGAASVLDLEEFISYHCSEELPPERVPATRSL